MAIGYVKAMNEYVRGKDESMQQFAAQLKGLSDADKAWYAAQISAEFGIEVEPPAPKKTEEIKVA